MSRRGWLRLLAAGALTAWLCLFLHRDSTEKSMVRALLAEKNGGGWMVGLLYQFPQAEADSSEAEAAIRLCTGRGTQLSEAITSAEGALPQQADWRLCEYLLVSPASARQVLPACEAFYLAQPYGRLASRVFAADFSIETLEQQEQESGALPEDLLQNIKDSAPAAPRLYEHGRGVLMPVVELGQKSARCRPELLAVTAEHMEYLDAASSEMALLLQGKSRTRTGEHLFETDAGPLRLRRAVIGTEQNRESFLIRVCAMSRSALPSGAEEYLSSLCTDTISRCWALGLDIAGLGAVQALREGRFTLTTKNVCPALRADVRLID